MARCATAAQSFALTGAILSCRLNFKGVSRSTNFSLVRQRSLVLSGAAMGKTVVSTDKAPGAVGPYSQAIKAGGLLFVSGQIPLRPGGNAADFPADIEAQTQQALTNLGHILEAGGSSLDKVVKTTVLLADMEDFAKVNLVYCKFFTKDPPARACYAVKALPLGAKVEIEAIASCED